MEKEIEAEAKKLYDYYNKLSLEYKKITKKKDETNNKEPISAELALVLDKINKFRNEYSLFIKERKNSFGKFDINKYLEIKLIEIKAKKEKQGTKDNFLFINNKQFNTYEFTDENKLFEKQEENISEIEEKNEVVVYYSDTHMVNLLKKQKEFLKKARDKKIGLDVLTPGKRAKVLKSCDNFLNDIIYKLVCMANTREKKVLKKNDLYFLLKLHDINIEKEEEKRKRTFL
ncbi:hypothetical protein TUBRATIS_16250 [Tubulinosema ratisbonensis]|uniref:Uncharacterized protein n=1 Tax=Tubulinosema ratisbonensis TaxID=291195 RepID=A0A437AL56_9MICR|nr:hypothetical protein TUBRATIS_16250 [Tubulinosema ratisbonensis]